VLASELSSPQNPALSPANTPRSCLNTPRGYQCTPLLSPANTPRSCLNTPRGYQCTPLLSPANTPRPTNLIHPELHFLHTRAPLFELEQRAPPGDQALDASWGASSGTRGRGARAGASGAKTQHDSKIDRADLRPSTLTQRADASRLTPDDHHATPPHSLPDTTPRPIAPPSQPPFRHPTRCRLIRPSHTATFLRTPAPPGALPSPLLSSPRLLPCLVFNLSLN
jgi:hypothetical protein